MEELCKLRVVFNNQKILKPIKISARYFILRSGQKTKILYENQQVHFKSSKILEGWIDIFVEGEYSGTIPYSEFKINFKVDNLLIES